MFKNINWNCRVYSEFKQCLTLLCITHWKFGVSVWLFEKKGAQTNEVSVMAFRGDGSYKKLVGTNCLLQWLVTHWYLLCCSDESRGYVNNKSQESETCAFHSVFYSLCCLYKKFLCWCKFYFFLRSTKQSTKKHNPSCSTAPGHLFRRDGFSPFNNSSIITTV